MNEPNSLLLVNDHDLETDVAEFGTAIVRELYLASQKLAAGEADFAMAQRIVDRPLSLLRKWFRLFTVAEITCNADDLVFCGLQMPDSPFRRGLLRDLGRLGIRQLVFVPPMSPPELHALLNGISGSRHGDAESLSRHLLERGIKGVRLNDMEWTTRLANRKPYKRSDEQIVTVKSHVLRHWAEEADLICSAAAGSVPKAESLASRWNCYCAPQIIQAVLADRFQSLQAQTILDHARGLLDGSGADTSGGLAVRPPARYWKGLIEAVVRHPYGYELTHALRGLLSEHDIPLAIDDLLDSQVKAQYEATGVVDELTTRVFSVACTVDDLKSWGIVFAKLLRAGPSDRAAAILDALLLHLKRDDRDARRKAHYLLGSALSAASATDQTDVVCWLAERMASDIEGGEETFEFSDLLAGAGEILLSTGRLAPLAQMAMNLSKSVRESSHPTRKRVSESVLERWGQARWVSLLFRAVTDERDGDSADAAAMLGALGGKEVARRAVTHITHAQRRVRLTMLDLLGSMGPDATQVCIERMSPEELWLARNEGGQLTDESWYTVRNALHILGRVGGEGVLTILKSHAHDQDIRVRLEIIRALERIGTAEARTMLVDFASDPSLDIRRASMVALGASGGEHEVYVLKELFASDPESAETAIYAIGHIGGRAAKDFLFAILEDGDLLKKAGYAARSDPMREVTLKALVQNPDAEIVQRIETYCQAHNRTFRIPMVTENLSDTAKLTLARTREALKKKA
jgi:HEAT repeat protein